MNITDQTRDIEGKVKKLFTANGRCDINTHFEIGTRLHIDNYYYPKEFFIDSSNSLKIGIMLAQKIRQTEVNVQNLTLVGCGAYSSGYLHQACIYLNDELIPAS